VLGVSLDSAEDNLKFKKKHSFPFALLSDVTRKMSMDYGAVGFEQALLTRRITYVIDENGTIQQAFDHVTPANHADELLKLL